MSALARGGQVALALLAGVTLLAVLGAIGLALAAAAPGTQPARVVPVQAGPYALTVRLFKDPAQAGLALPFEIVPAAGTGVLTVAVQSWPGAGVDAQPIRVVLSPILGGAGAVRGAAEVPVRGPWTLHLMVEGAAGSGGADVPIEATAPPPLPPWVGWALGLLPLAALLVFLLLQRAPPPVQPAASTRGGG